MDSYVDALGHDMGQWFTVTAATCTADGMEQRNCSRRDYYESRMIEATGHSYDFVVTAPTCTKKGFTTHTCHCGDSYNDSYTDPLGHSFTNYVSDGNATCTQDGTKTAVCDRCDATDTKIDVGSARGHDFCEWMVVEDLAPNSDGLESQYCYHCGLEETRVITRLENPFTDVPVGSFFYGPVLWAVENGITNGVDATHFVSVNPPPTCKQSHNMKIPPFIWQCHINGGIFMNSGLQVYNEQAKLAQWAQVMSQCRDSGLSVRQWCQEHGVNVSSY